MNILMIEDDRELCSAVSFRLEQEGFSVTLCHDGEEGLYYMQETPYDLVILDRMLPHMNGIEILKGSPLPPDQNPGYHPYGPWGAERPPYRTELRS